MNNRIIINESESVNTIDMRDLTDGNHVALLRDGSPAGFASIDHENIYVWVNDSEKTCQINFGKMDVGGKNIHIYGGTNNIIIENSEINCRSFNAFGDAVLIEANSKIITHHFEALANHVESHGSIKTDNMLLNINAKQSGMENYGELFVKGTIRQINGKFHNKGRVEASRWEMDGHDYVINDSEAELKVTSAQLNIDTYFDKGVSVFGDSVIHCINADISGSLNAKKFEIRAKDWVNFDASSRGSFNSLVCAANNNISFNGNIFSSQEILAVSANIHLNNKFEMKDCGEVKMLATGLLKSHREAKFDHVTDLDLRSKQLFVESSCDATRSISLEGSEMLVVQPGASVTAESIKLAGEDLYLYGQLSGELSFPDKIRHLYLSDKSVIEKCKDMKVRAYFVEALGKVTADMNQIIAELAVVTGDEAQINVALLDLKSKHIKLSGHLVTKELQSIAEKYQALTPTLALEAVNSRIEAFRVHIAGFINSGINVVSEHLLNSAKINNHASTSLTGVSSLINCSGSSITSSNVSLGGGMLANHGEINAVESIDTQADCFYACGTSQTKSAKGVINANNISLAGNLEATDLFYAKAKGDISLSTSNKLKGGKVRIEADNNISGSLNISSKSADVFAGKSAMLTDGTSEIEEILTLRSHELIASNTMAAKHILLRKPTDATLQEVSSAYLSSDAVIKAEVFFEDVGDFTASCPIEADEYQLSSSDGVVLAKGADVKFKRSFMVKSKRYQQSGSVDNPGKDVEDNSRAVIDAEDVNFIKGSSVTGQAPVFVSAKTATYSGLIDTPSLQSTSIESSFEAGSDISKRTILTVMGRADTRSIVTVEQGADIKSSSFRAVNVDKLILNENLSATDIKVQVSHLHLGAFAVLGTMLSQIQIDAKSAYLEGRIEASHAFIKCSDSIIRDGTKGNSAIKATNLTMTAPLMVNFLGVTEAQQASFTSFINLAFGFNYINYGVDNSMFTLSAFSTVLHYEFLYQTFEDMQSGKIDIFSANYMQYTVQGLLGLFKPLLPPLILNALNITMSSYFTLSNASQIGGMLKHLCAQKDIKFVDLLPLLTTTKNMAISTLGLYHSLEELAVIAKHPILDGISDVADYLSIDLPDVLRDKFHRHQAKKDGKVPDDKGNIEDLLRVQVLSSVKDVEKKTDMYLDRDKPASGKSWFTSTYEAIQDDISIAKNDFFKDPGAFIKKTALSTYNASNELFSNYILPELLIVAPSFNQDAFFNYDLFKPVLTGSYNQRGIFTGSIFSSHLGLNNSKVGLYSLSDNSRQFSYVESLSGAHIDMNANSYAHTFLMSSNNFTLGEGYEVRPAVSFMDESHAMPHNVKASKSATFKYDTVDNEDDFLRLSGQYACYQPDNPSKAHVTHITNHQIDFYKNLILPWSATIQATGIYVNDRVLLKANGGDGLGLVSTENSIVNHGILAGDIVSLQSADKIDMVSGITKSKKVYLTAYNDINLDHSHIHANEGYIRSQRGHAQFDASTVIFDEFGAIIAHTDVLANCSSQNIRTKHCDDKAYSPSILKGGKGKDHHDLGLYIYSGGRIINAGSQIGAIGNYCLDGNHGVMGVAYTNPYRYKDTNHRNILGINRSEVVDSVRVQHPTFFSKTGRGIIRASHGCVDVTAGIFDSKLSTYIFSHDAPMFRDVPIHNTNDTNKSLFGYRFADKHHESDENEGQVFVSPESLGIECFYGDIIIPNSSIETDYFVTDAWSGKTRIYQDTVNHSDRTTYLTLACHAGPLHYSLNTDPGARQQNTFSLSDPLLDSVKSAKNSKSGSQAISPLLSVADSGAGKMRALTSGKYGDCIDTSVGVSVGHTTNESHYQTDGKYSLNIGKWDDYSRDGIALGGMSGCIGELDMHCGNTFDVSGHTLSYSNSSRTMTGGVSYNPLTEKYDVSGSYLQSKSNGQVASPARLSIKRAIFRNETQVSLNNAQVHVGSLHGNLSNLTLTSAYDDATSSSRSFSASASDIVNGGGVSAVGAGYHASSTHEVNSPATFEVDDLSDGHINHVSSYGGRLTGSGFEDHKPDSVDQIGARNSNHSIGIDATFNVIERRPQNIAISNVNDTSTTSIAETDRGITMISSEEHHGFDISVVVPSNIISLVQQYQGDKNNKSGEGEVFSQDSSRQEDVTSDDSDLSLISQTNWANPLNYVDDLNSLPISTQGDASSAVVPEENSNKSVSSSGHSQDEKITNVSNSDVSEISYTSQSDNSSHEGVFIDAPEYEESVVFVEDMVRNYTHKDYIYRGDARGPDVILKEGFSAKGKNTDLFTHAIGYSGEDDSAYISFTKDKDVAKKFPYDFNEESDILSEQAKYIYETNRLASGIDVAKKLRHHPAIDMEDFKTTTLPEQEIAILDHVRSSDVKGYWKIYSSSESLNASNYVRNENYCPMEINKSWINVGRGLGALGVGYLAYSEGMNLYQGASSTIATHNSNFFSRALTNVGFTMSFSLTGAGAGARAGAIACAPVLPPYGPVVCGLIGGVVGGTVSGYIADKYISKVTPSEKLYEPRLNLFSASQHSNLPRRSIKRDPWLESYPYLESRANTNFSYK